MVLLSQVSTCFAQENWLYSFEFVGANKPVDGTVFADTEYTIEVVIMVPYTLDGARFSISIPSAHEPITPTTPFWEIVSDYAGVDSESMKALANRVITFKVVKGELRLRVKFRIPSKNIVVYTITAPNGVDYNIYTVIEDYPLVSAIFENNPVGNIEFRLTSSKVYDYESKREKLQTAFSSEYEDLVDTVVGESDKLNDAGLTDYAISLVDSLLGLKLPEPPNPMLLYGLALTSIVLGVLSIVFISMYTRARGETAYIKRVVSSSLVDMASIETSLSRLDTKLARNLSDVVEKLKKVGR
ncbi:MAG: hypothetical protein QXI36_02410 [Candidatus Bathyarchaeia archaeon]